MTRPNRSTMKARSAIPRLRDYYTLPEPYPVFHVSTHRNLSSFGRALNHRKKLSRFHDLDALVVPDAEQMPVAAD